MPTLGMSCAGCVFRVEGFESDQVACKMDVLDDIMKESSICEIVDHSYQFDRVCPYKSNTPKKTKDAKKDASFPFHFLIIDTDTKQTKKTFNKIKPLIEEYNSKVCIVTTGSIVDLQSLADENPNVYIAVSFEQDEDTFSLMDKAFESVSNGYSIVLTSGQFVDKTDLDKITTFVNDKMKRLALIQDSPFVINNVIFKYLKGNKGSSFKDKIDALTTEQKVVNMVFTWEEIDEVINS